MSMTPAEKQIYEQMMKLTSGIGQLNQTMTTMARAMGARVDGRTALPGEIDQRFMGGRKAAKKSSDAVDDLTESMIDTSETLDQVSKDYNINAKSVKDVAKSWKKLDEVVKEHGGHLAGLNRNFHTWGQDFFSVRQHAKKIVEGMGRYSTALAKSAKMQSMLYANQLRDITRLASDPHQQAAAYEKLTDALENLDDGAKRALGVLDEATGKIRTDLSFDDLAQKRAALGDVLADITQNLASTGIGSFKDIAKLDPSSFFTDRTGGPGNDKGSQNRAAMVKVAAALEAAGLIKPSAAQSVFNKDGKGNILGMKSLSQLEKAFNPQSLKQIADALEKINRTVKQTDDLISALNSPLGRLTTTLTTAEGRMGLVNKALASFVAAGALVKAKQGLSEFYNELMKFNVAHIPATYKEVMTASVKMGMSFEEASALFAENKRILAIQGPQAFAAGLQQLKGTFKEFGFTMKQGAELVGPALESAITTGVNIRDRDALNKTTTDMMTSFKKISGVVNTTAKEYFDLTSQLYKTEGVFDNLMGMDNARSQAYSKELIRLRDKYAVDGMSLQQANEMVALQEKQKREKVSTRFGDAGKMMVMARMSGMSNESAQDLYKLSIKGRGRSAEESERFNSLLGQLGRSQEQANQNAYDNNMGSGIAFDVMRERMGLEGNSSSMMQNMQTIEAAKRAGATLSPQEQAAAAARANGSAQLSAFGNVVNSVSSVMNSALLAGAIGAATGLGAVMMNAIGAARALGMMKGKLDILSGNGVAPGGKGAAGKGGRFGKFGSLARGVGGGLGGVALGMGAGLASDALMGAGHTKSGAVVDILGSAGGAAMTGAMLGSVIPGVGTLIGGAVGGLAGGAYGLYNNWGNFGTPVSPVMPSINAPGTELPGVTPEGINTPGQSQGSLLVKDATVAEHLVALANLQTQMVNLLQKISEKEGVALATTQMQSIPQISPQQSVSPAYSYFRGPVSRTSS